VKCEITANVFSKILDTTNGQEFNNVETDRAAPILKEEDYSVIHCSVSRSPYEAEHGIEEELPGGSEEAVSAAAISDQASPEDSAFYQYSKYADQGLGSAIDECTRQTKRILSYHYKAW